MNKKKLLSEYGKYMARKRWGKMTKKERSDWTRNVYWPRRRKALQDKEKSNSVDNS